MEIYFSSTSIRFVSLEKYRFTSASVYLLFFTEIALFSCAVGKKPVRCWKKACNIKSAVGKKPVRKKPLYHSVYLYEMCNSCTNVFPNTRAWEQQELNKPKKQKKRGMSMERSIASTKEKEVSTAKR